MSGAILCLLAWSLSGQARKPPVPAESAVPWPIESLAVTGNQHYSTQQILAVAGLKAGQRALPKDFEAARDRLAATGVFERIDFRYGSALSGKGYAVSFEVFEAGPWFPVAFEGLPAPAEQLKEALRRSDPLFGDQIPATEQILQRYARTIEEHLASLGRKEKVAGRLLPGDTGELAVVFQPAATPPVVALVKFSGNQVIPTAALAKAISGVAVGMPYKEARFRQFLEINVRPLYEARGRVRVAFPEIQTEKAKDVNGLVVTVKVEEGVSYNIGEVRLEGPGIAAEELKKIADLNADDVANFDEVRAALGRLERRYQREGYMRAAARLERAINDQRKTVDLAIRVEAGPQYVFGKLAIEGLDIHGEDAVRKLWGLKEGQRFNADYPGYFLERIREEALFDNLGKTRAVLEQDDENHTVNVKLMFAAPEKPKKPKTP
jgi:outer membrane protein insertion porin family